MDESGPFHGQEVGEPEPERFADHAFDRQLVGVGGNDRIGAGDGIEAELVVSRQRNTDGVADGAADAPERVVDLRADGNADPCQPEDSEHRSTAHVDRLRSRIGTTRRLSRLLGHGTPPLAVRLTGLRSTVH